VNGALHDARRDRHRRQQRQRRRSSDTVFVSFVTFCGNSGLAAVGDVCLPRRGVCGILPPDTCRTKSMTFSNNPVEATADLLHSRDILRRLIQLGAPCRRCWSTVPHFSRSAA
jgi:hypothetical protein